MKLSVSVPDDLWESTRIQRPDLNPSHLVQEALEAWTRSHTEPAFSQDRPADAADAFSKVRDRLARQAREDFEVGYRGALQAAEVLEFWVIESLADRHFDVAAWADGFAWSAVAAAMGNIPREWAPDGEIIHILVKTLGSLVSPYGDDAFKPSAPYLQGFARAMRDLWQEAFEGTASSSGSNVVPQTKSKTRSRSGGPQRSKSASASGVRSKSNSGRNSHAGAATTPSAEPEEVAPG